MQQLQRFSQGDLVRIEPLRQQLANAMLLEQIQRLIGELAQGQLAQPLGGRIDRGQHIAARRAGLGFNQTIFRVDDLGALVACLDLAIAEETTPRRQRALLALGEVEKAQGEQACLIPQAADHHAPSGRNYLAIDYLPLHIALHAGQQFTYGQGLGSVFIAQGEVKEQILHGTQMQMVEFLRHLAADALEAGNGYQSQIHASPPNTVNTIR